ncbi:MAG: alkaline phosphatase family protein [Candidatus Izemoplasmataceae bacterium]
MRTIDYKKNIINVPASILKWANIKAPHDTLKLLDDALSIDINHVILVLLDGFGANLIPNLNDQSLIKNAMKTSLDSVFPPTTAAATTSILTGLTPYETGFLGWFQYFKDYDTYYTIFMGDDYYDHTKLIDPFFKEAFNRETFIDQINKDKNIAAKAFFPYPIDKEGYESINHGLKEVSQFTKKHAKTVSYFYSVEPDLTQHKTGTKSKETLTMINALNQSLEAFKNTLSKDTLVIMTADHGLTDVLAIDINQDSTLNNYLRVKPSVEPRATNFHVKDGLHEAFKAYFKKHYQDYFTLLDQKTFLEKGYLGFGKKHPFVSMCLGDYIAIAHDQYYFDLTSENKHKAHHAGIKEDELKVPLVIFKGAI